jgi:hypothetical protein
MKAIKTIVLLLSVLTLTSMMKADSEERIESCVAKSGPGAIYLKEFLVNLPAADKGKPSMFRLPIILRGNNIYRFNLCSQEGEAVIRIYDSSKIIVSSYDSKTGKNYDPINFMCRKTGQYMIVINFQNGAAGEAVGIMSHVKK